jgi:Tfp pilus assembly protein PilX
MIKKRSDRGGFAIVMVIMVLVVLLPLAMGLTFWTNNHRRQTLSNRLHVKEYYQSRAAVQEARRQMQIGGGGSSFGNMTWGPSASFQGQVQMDSQTLVAVLVCHEEDNVPPPPGCP